MWQTAQKIPISDKQHVTISPNLPYMKYKKMKKN